ncbi:hypothetical protein Tco_0461805 [Tanacetum coccineum]
MNKRPIEDEEVVGAGWEGIAHDSRVLTEVVHNPTSGFPLPPLNKYYLCDAAYSNTRGFMAPYRNIRKRIFAKGRKTKPKTTKPSTRWKRVKDKANSKPVIAKVNRKVNPDKFKSTKEDLKDEKCKI